MIPRLGRFAVLQVGLALLAIGSLGFLGALTPERVFLLVFIGFLIALEAASPTAHETAPRWWRRLQWLTLVGLAGVGYLLWRQVVQVLPSGGA